MNDFNKLFREELDSFHYTEGGIQRPHFCILGRKEWNSFMEYNNEAINTGMTAKELYPKTHDNPEYEGIQLLLSRQESIIKFVL